MSASECQAQVNEILTALDCAASEVYKLKRAEGADRSHIRDAALEEVNAAVALLQAL